MKDLEKLIHNKDTSSRSFQVIKSMSSKDFHIEITQKQLENALELKGEILIITMQYEEFDQELISQKLKYAISQALSVIVSYEEDAKHQTKIENFVKYISEISDSQQNSTFGIKKVKKLSNEPITILLTGILPINQLKMGVSQNIWDLINSDDKYFIPRFQEYRKNLSKLCGVPILPLLPYLDTQLTKNYVQLLDLKDDRVISKFQASQELTKQSVEDYLYRLEKIYVALCSM